jgi:hypothetical protein
MHLPRAEHREHAGWLQDHARHKPALRLIPRDSLLHSVRIHHQRDKVL